MAIALKGGELYFITELDLLTGKRSGYYKIGLVKDARKGDSSTRRDEHQTANPRLLEVDAVVTCPAIEALETAMHARYAPQRVRGEWFRLSPAQLAAAVTAATTLSALLDEAVPALQRAARAQAKQPTATVGRPKADDLEWHLQAVRAKHVAGRVKKLRGQVTDLLKSAKGAGADVDGLVEIRKPGSPTVSKTRVAAVRPDLVEQFTRTTESEQRSFKLLGTKPVDDVVVPKALITAEEELGALLRQKRRSRKHLEAVHGMFLDIAPIANEADWALEFATAEIMASCGRRSGIDGICSWTWQVRSTTSFDAAAFVKAHPRLAEQCMTQPAAGFTVLPMRGYTPRR
jgi:hypothetical protein